MKKEIKKLVLNKKTISNLDTIAMGRIVGAANSVHETKCGCSGFCSFGCSYGCTVDCTNTCKGHTCNYAHQC